MAESVASQGGMKTTGAASHAIRPIRILIILLVIGGVASGGWLLSTGWTPWVAPAGPLIASGTLEADEVLVGAEVLGRIVAMAQEGDPVQADEVVMQLDDSLIQLQLHQANLAVRQQLEIQADRFRLRTPISGVVTRAPMHVGETVTPGQTALAVADLTSLRLTVYVLERDLGQVQIGQRVAVTADPFPGRSFPGVVTATNPRAEFTPRNVQTQADRLNLVFGVKVRVENPEGLLKPGMPADAHFPSLPGSRQP